MGLSLPYSLSPSKVSSFTECGLAFRFSAIDRLPEPPSAPASRGTLVHAALERLMLLPNDHRTLPAALTCLDQAIEAFRTDPEFTGLGLDPAAEAAFLDEAEVLVRRYFELEDPTSVNPIGLELRLEADVGNLRLRGIIDRLELDDDGRLVVTDYKSGKAPHANYERGRLGGVHFYSFLCERLFGQRPAKVQLLYLADPMAITVEPSEQSTKGLERKVKAVWAAIERACERDDFKPRQSRLCDWCAFQAYCPAFGGDPAQAVELRRPAETGEPASEPAGEQLALAPA
jgi:putative RecB family exonuclease